MCKGVVKQVSFCFFCLEFWQTNFAKVSPCSTIDWFVHRIYRYLQVVLHAIFSYSDDYDSLELKSAT